MKKCADARASFRKTSAFEGKAKPATSRWFPPLQQPHGPTKRLIADKSEGPVFVMTGVRAVTQVHVEVGTVLCSNGNHLLPFFLSQSTSVDVASQAVPLLAFKGT